MINPEDVQQVLAELRPYLTEICEVSLADWQDNPNSGAWVKFRLPDESHLNVYRGRNRAGRTQKFGQRYHLMLIEINDDETAIPAPRDPEPKARKLSSLAGLLCNYETFRAWCEKESGEECPDSDSAAEVIRMLCGIESRAELDTNPEAAKVFRGLLERYDREKSG